VATIPFRTKPMLATLVDEPFDRPGWVYEEKYDGFRILAYKEGARVRLESRNAKDRTESFPGVARAVGRLRAETALLDGEVAAFDRRGVSRFQLLQSSQQTLVYAVFDCLYLNGRDLRSQSLAERRRALEATVADVDGLLVSRRLAQNGLAAYQSARRRGLEGLVAKDLESTYVEGRSTRWLKVKVHQEEELVIAGYTEPSGARQRFGALLLGAYRGRELHFVGKVGTGFTAKTLEDLWRAFQPLRRESSPFADQVRERGVTWLEPKLVAQIAFTEWTDDAKLRHPAYLGLRDDKAALECVLPGARGVAKERSSSRAPAKAHARSRTR